MYKELIQNSGKGKVIPGEFPCQNTSQCPTPEEYNFFSILHFHNFIFYNFKLRFRMPRLIYMLNV